MNARRKSPSDPMRQMQEHACEASGLLKAMGNEQRLLILCQLVGRETSVGELQAQSQLSQSALSQHLALLREMGLVDTRREAQTIYYSLPDGPVVRVMALLQDIYCTLDAKPAGGEAPHALCDD